MTSAAQPVIAELLRDVWAMEPRALDAFLRQLATRNFPVVGASLAQTAQPRNRTTMAGRTAQIPITGVLVKAAPWWFSLFGVDHTTYGELQSDLAMAAQSDDVDDIVLRVDSPGGQVAGVKEASDSIRAAASKKRVTAAVEDMCASGAYWLASQADAISAGPNAMVGSIGVYSAYVDSSKAADMEGLKIHVIASGAHKGMGVPGAPISEDQLGAMREVIDGMAANFVSDVARGRRRSTGSVQEWATGRVWIAEEARKLGLIDAVQASAGNTSSGVRAAAGESLKGESMSDIEKAAAEKAKAAQDVRAEERQRLTGLKAAFPDEPAFAMEQYEKGATLVEAKAAFSDVLAERGKQLAKENEDLKKAMSRTGGGKGAPPVTQEGDPGVGSQETFMSAAEDYAAEHDCSMREALSHIARTRKDLYDRHLVDAGGGQILERRRQYDASKSGKR